ncbi:uncharacterized protein LOC128213380 [Mya arenaria]|uniref:uncharacterized protein LOC128213380 n=1 Tax=Mya arenaria TaxID=6604 RepID=UPI0022E22C3E|nr:uncharacterized protein LOC128213380 [Mya arenaria]
MIHQGLASEPKCSRFDYEERLLEKMVRLEWQFGRLQEELREARVALVDGRTKADSTLQGHIERLVGAEKMPRISVSESERKMEKVILNVTETANKALLKLDKNIDNQKSAVVVFRARSPSNTVVAEKNIVVFSEVILNIGAGYAPSTGTFTSPTSGLYMFTVQLCVEKDKSMYFELINGGIDRLQI